MKKPNIIVHLDLTPEESVRRIRMRNRECEAGITVEYMTSLHAAYESFISDIARVIPVIKVDYSRFRTAEEMAVMIRHEYTKIANIRHVGVDSSSYTVKLPPVPSKTLVQPAGDVTDTRKFSDDKNEAEYDRYADLVSS